MWINNACSSNGLLNSTVKLGDDWNLALTKKPNGTIEVSMDWAGPITVNSTSPHATYVDTLYALLQLHTVNPSAFILSAGWPIDDLHKAIAKALRLTLSKANIVIQNPSITINNLAPYEVVWELPLSVGSEFNQYPSLCIEGQALFRGNYIKDAYQALGIATMQLDKPWVKDKLKEILQVEGELTYQDVRSFFELSNCNLPWRFYVYRDRETGNKTIMKPQYETHYAVALPFYDKEWYYYILSCCIEERQTKKKTKREIIGEHISRSIYTTKEHERYYFLLSSYDLDSLSTADGSRKETIYIGWSPFEVSASPIGG
jgi:hypothetical protein